VTEYALVLVKKELRGEFLRFGIVTPLATKGAPLEKYGGANSVAVVHAKALYLGDF
jgi:hypothetical protein